ncbi:MAG TPA: hypothetical protein GXX75_10785 [Clostridiales bacterium]|nr:hypothetical protein [Clostridiales bacterium]
MRISYSEANLSYVPNIVMSMGVLFFVMTWIGYSYQDVEEPVSEQLLVLKLQSADFYNLSKVVFLLIISLSFSVIGIAFPMIQNVLNHFRVFNRAITFLDIIAGVVLHFIVAAVGIGLGSLFHPRIVKDKKMSVLMVVTAALLGYTKGAVILKILALQFLLWIFPPVYDILASFNGMEYFGIRHMVLPVLYGCVYCLAVVMLQLLCLKKVKF